MPIIFGNSIITSELGAASRDNKVDNADANFYSTIRQTIQGLDRLIDGVIFTGTGFLVTILGIAGVLFITKTHILFWNVDAARLGACFIAFGAFILAVALFLRLLLYVSFLGEAVKIAEQIEKRLLDGDFQLTHKFQSKRGAGENGWWLLRIFPVGGVLASAFALVFFLYGTFGLHSNADSSTPPPSQACPSVENKSGL